MKILFLLVNIDVFIQPQFNISISSSLSNSGKLIFTGFGTKFDPVNVPNYPLLF